MFWGCSLASLPFKEKILVFLRQNDSGEEVSMWCDKRAFTAYSGQSADGEWGWHKGLFFLEEWDHEYLSRDVHLWLYLTLLITKRLKNSIKMWCWKLQL